MSEPSNKKSPSDYLREALTDPLLMDAVELDSYLDSAGFDFSAFSNRLKSDLELTAKQLRLKEARESRQRFTSTLREVVDRTSMTLEDIRKEIQKRLSVLGGEPVAVFNRNFEQAETKEDLLELLEDIERLEERSGKDKSAD